MYYPSFFAGIRPFETLHTRDRVDNPLDLSVKQAVARPEGACAADPQQIHLMMERKLAAAGLAAHPLAQQMPLLDSMYAYKPFGTDSTPCPIGGTGLMGQTLANPYCSSGSPALNRLNLIPDLLQQNRDVLALEATASSLTHYPMDSWNMRIGSIGSAAIAMNNANQRVYFGHNSVGSVLPPHMTGSFGASIPHISLYTDLLNDMSRRPVEREKSVFSALPDMRAPVEPTTLFSDHLQRLREQHLQQSKCSAPCCLPTPALSAGAQRSSCPQLLSATNGNNGCNCCNIGLSMPNNMAPLIMPSSTAQVSTSVSHKDVCNRDVLTNSENHVNHSLNDKLEFTESVGNNDRNNNSFCDNSYNTSVRPIERKELKSQTNLESQSSQKSDMTYASPVPLNPKPQLWNPSHSCKPVVIQNDLHNNRTDIESDNCDSKTKVDDKKGLSESQNRNKEVFAFKQSLSNKNSNFTTKSETGFSHRDSTSLSAPDVITLDEDYIEYKPHNIGMDESTDSSTQNCKSIDRNTIKTKNNLKPILMSSVETSPLESVTALMAHKSNQISDSCEPSNGSGGHVIIGDSEVSTGTTGNASEPRNRNMIINLVQSQSQSQRIQNSNQIKCSRLESYCGGNTADIGQEMAHQSDHQIYSESTKVTQNTSKDSAVNANSGNSANCAVKCKANITKQLKDYKLVSKNQTISTIDKHKRQPKQTKTVEVQCNGPDWTPIVLPNQLKTKLQKVVRNQMLFNITKHANKQSIDQKKDDKKKKRCQLKHIHRKQNRSRSSSSSTTSSRRSSPERKRQLNCDTSSGKSRKRSMLQCIVNSHGYVADKIKRPDVHNLFASDPSVLGREERALQRAMKHFEEQHESCNSDNSAKNSAQNFVVKQNKNKCNEKKNNSNAINTISTGSHNDCTYSENMKYELVIESVVNESRLTYSSDSKSNKNDEKNSENKVSEEILKNKNTLESLDKIKTKTKRKLNQKLEKGSDVCEADGVEGKGVDVKCNQNKKIKANENCEERVDKSDEKSVQQKASLQCKQKKTIVSVRRRRFRSGLDMIRNPHRRKKSRINYMKDTNTENKTNRDEELNRSDSNLKTSEDMAHKSNLEQANGSVPTEMKRLMVNKALGETLLHRAARSNRKDVINSCLQSNTCDVNVRDNANYTPLHECAIRGHLHIARTLLEHGADVEASATGGIRPIHDAIENNHLEVVRLLLSYGADPNISTYSGSTPVQLSRSKAMLKFLRGDSQTNDCKEETLFWKFKESANISDTNQIGFNVLDGLPPDIDDESHDFLFEVSDQGPLDPTYRLPNSRTKGTEQFMRLSDVLRRMGLKRDQFVKKHSNVQIVSISRQELERATIGQLLTKAESNTTTSDNYCEDIIVFDDNIRSILGIETIKLR